MSGSSTLGHLMLLQIQELTFLCDTQIVTFYANVRVISAGTLKVSS